MADVSKINVGGTTYNVKDTVSGYIKTHQDISGKANLSGATFTGKVTVPLSSNYTIPSNTVVRASADQILATAMGGTMIWHDLFAFCKQSVPKYYTSTNGTTWTESTLDKSLFAQQGNNSKALLTSTVIGARWVWGTDTSSLAWGSGEWLVIGVTYQEKTANYTVKFESSADNSAWTVRHESTGSNAIAPVYFKLNSYNGDRYLRLTITKSASDAGVLNIGQIRMLTARYGSQGMGIELEYPYSWDADRNVTFPARVNATSFNGYTIAKSVPSDAKFTDTTYSNATQSANGLMSSTDKKKLDGIASGATANVGTVTSVAVKMNGSVKGTVTSSGTIDLGSVPTGTIPTKTSQLTNDSGFLTTTNLGNQAVYSLSDGTLTITPVTTLGTQVTYTVSGGTLTITTI